jgi:ABC-type multidrug transport system ATPase subunit
LLDALNGRRPATSGQVLYNGADFYAAFDMFRASIGYVPQQDIVHRKILVQNALRYTARLRLPPDTSDEEIDFHVSRVLKQVGLGDKALLPIDTPSPLSGGQFKRISLAVELIANPNILFLDEVTSGLDAGTDKKMMQLFAELAAEQKTVVCITHTLENIDTCNLVLLLHQGKMIYFGPPKSANAYFNVSRLSEVYDFIETHPIDYWTKKFEESSYFSDYIKNRSSALEADYQPQRDKPGNCIESRQAQFHFRQLITLLRRNINLLLADRRNLAIMFLQAPLVGILVGLVFDISSSAQARAATESNIGFILVLSSIWCGCLNSTREVIKELPIYLRERAVNLGIGSYLASKLIPLTVICLVQCFTLLSTVTLLTSWSGDFIGRLCTLFLAAMAATCMGLAVSTLVDSNDKAVAFIPILLIPQVILSNSIVRLEKVGAGIAQATVIAFSSFDAMKATLSSEATTLAPAEMALQADLITTVCLAVGFLLAALLGLKLKDMKSK